MAPKKSGTRMGRIMPPVDVNHASLMGEFEKRVKAGPLTLVFVYADWCGHCQNYKKTFEQLENNKNRTVQIARLRDDVVGKANIANAKIEGYPSVILVNNKNEALTFETENGEKTNDIPDSRNVNKMNLIVENAGKNGSIVSQNQNMTKPSENVETSIPNSISRSSYPNTLKPVEVPEESADMEPANSLVYKSRPSKIEVQAGGCGCALQTGGGGLYGLLSSVAMNSLPAMALLGLAQRRSIPKTKKKSRRIRKTLKKKRGSRR
jgi:thiol-disulfide isomerase/thioredoxin